MFRQTRYLGICAGCALVCATAAAGQSAGDAAGLIDGTVRDASGAVLSQVVVRAVGPALMGAREDVSRDDGFYRIPALAPGDYELTFTRAGFEQAIRRDVRVRSGATTTPARRSCARSASSRRASRGSGCAWTGDSPSALAGPCVS